MIKPISVCFSSASSSTEPLAQHHQRREGEPYDRAPGVVRAQIIGERRTQSIVFLNEPPARLVGQQVLVAERPQITQHLSPSAIRMLRWR